MCSCWNPSMDIHGEISARSGMSSHLCIGWVHNAECLTQSTHWKYKE
jgi:hypothetical protein